MVCETGEIHSCPGDPPRRLKSFELQLEQTPQVSHTGNWIRVRISEPPADFRGENEKEMTSDDFWVLRRSNSPVLLGSPDKLFNAGKKTPADFLKGRGLFSFRIKNELLQHDAGKRRVLGKATVVALGNRKELIE